MFTCLDRPPINPAWVVGLWLVRDKGSYFDASGPFRCVRFGGSVIVSLSLLLAQVLRHSTWPPLGSAPIDIITFNTMVISRG